MWELPLVEKVARLRQPEVRGSAARRGTTHQGPVGGLLRPELAADLSAWRSPGLRARTPTNSAAAVATRDGRSPQEVVLDWLLERDGLAFLFAPLGAYDGNLDSIREMNAHPASVAGLSDGGAHCGLICDASFPTYLLTHWARDRTRGEQLPLELVVHKQTGATARTFGLSDRGLLAPGCSPTSTSSTTTAYVCTRLAW